MVMKNRDDDGLHEDRKVDLIEGDVGLIAEDGQAVRIAWIAEQHVLVVGEIIDVPLRALKGGRQVVTEGNIQHGELGQDDQHQDPKADREDQIGAEQRAVTLEKRRSLL